MLCASKASKQSQFITIITSTYSSLTSAQSFPLRPPCPCSLSNIIFSVTKTLSTSFLRHSSVLANILFTPAESSRGALFIPSSLLVLAFIFPKASTVPGLKGPHCCLTPLCSQLLRLSDPLQVLTKLKIWCSRIHKDEGLTSSITCRDEKQGCSHLRKFDKFFGEKN